MKNNRKQRTDNSLKYKIISAIYGINCLNPYSFSCYSQDGEEIYLAEKFCGGGQKKGFYVDIGAYHPYRFSNTYWAYKRGWNGINIEPNKNGYALLEKHRTRDINLCCGVGEQRGNLNYYEFTEPAFNTFDRSEFEGKRVPDRVVHVPVYRLEEILEKYSVDKIQFMDIDVEGMELSVLKSNNWSKWKPEFILVEQKGMDIEGLEKSEIYSFLKEHGYTCEWKSLRTVIYKIKNNS